ncbi:MULTISPECIES: thiamine pyrophosphate-dependent dehydrogenase E1 component subunit alpha [Cryobacterium]|uniref:2-oxoisovalerate dehydrogenase subunit alpha n=1 Tax=Cryobacterium breve TaxID=1259258 RepID=A0ABY2IX97_9MICO|nr:MULTISPECIES: thiamine pyrophosphate-dependent dehydrogenase E1 component subunit alpha [Cryobacterium]TFC94873.1 thiamine pyrophosphate-dependent dehydrogenase E1 component subunit alpha [Cryobacterium breve]TFC95003.1 thiamine pyrophosphate-dependent dehydrogenase E1 component subunit alpha [Cryobacterium sp. TmT3-12]
MPTASPTVRLLSPEGVFAPSESAAEFLPYLDRLTEADYRRFYRDMVVVRRFDTEAANLQRQGQLALWVPSHGQEAAQVGSAYATRPQDHVFPSYREHVVGMIRGLDPVDILRMLRGVTLGGWTPEDHGNFHLYTLVLASQTLHATGYAMGMQLDGATATGNPETDQAVIVYYGDGASSQGDANEALVFAASYQTPQVFFLQNNHWAISVPVTRQSRTPLYLRAGGFGMPGTQIDGNDVLASYAVTAKHLDDARAGHGPALIEALTYRVGAHTTADDPTKYRDPEQLAYWVARDPIVRFRSYLQGLGVEQEFLDAVDVEADDYAADVRRRALDIHSPDRTVIFDNVYAEPHPLIQEQQAWLDGYEASFEGGDA